MKSPRSYQQTARAEAAEATADQILRAFADCMRTDWFDSITVERVAEQAGVTPRTVIRRFGGKNGLLTAFVEEFVRQADQRREAKSGDVSGAIAGLVDLYEEWGDGVIRNLAQEPRHPALSPLLDFGRRRHREATATIYAAWLERLEAPAKRRLLDALIAATDVYVWKLLRRDLGRPRAEVERTIRLLVEAALAAAADGTSAGR
jgi:AcrR family transcriptional regulator